MIATGRKDLYVCAKMNWMLVILRAICGTGCMICSFAAMRYLNISDASVLIFTNPMFCIIFVSDLLVSLSVMHRLDCSCRNRFILSKHLFASSALLEFFWLPVQLGAFHKLQFLHHNQHLVLWSALRQLSWTLWAPCAYENSVVKRTSKLL